MRPAAASEPPHALAARHRPLVMGILNCTPDSFYPGSRVPGAAEAVARGLRMLEEGADILDVGGESTRPGAEPVPAEEELRRVLPVVAELARRGATISIDTSKAAVAERALEAGATILNDVRALRGDARMPAAAARFPVVILMHMQGSPRDMQRAPRYGEVVREVGEFLRERVAAFAAAGGDPGRAWLDPGIGFGKTLEHNLELMRRLEELAKLGPLVLGASRKSFLGKALGSEAAPLPPEERLEASLAAACRAAEAGARAVRAHDAGATARALEAYAKMRGRP